MVCREQEITRTEFVSQSEIHVTDLNMLLPVSEVTLKWDSVKSEGFINLLSVLT